MGEKSHSKKNHPTPRGILCCCKVGWISSCNQLLAGWVVCFFFFAQPAPSEKNRRYIKLVKCMLVLSSPKFCGVKINKKIVETTTYQLVVPLNQTTQRGLTLGARFKKKIVMIPLPYVCWKGFILIYMAQW